MKVRLKNTGSVMVQVCDEIEPILASSNFFANAPFESVNLILRYGVRNNVKPEYQKICREYNELPIAVELDATMLQSADRSDKTRLKCIITLAALEGLIDVAKRYGLPFLPLNQKKEESESSSGIHLS